MPTRTKETLELRQVKLTDILISIPESVVVVKANFVDREEAW